MAVDSVVPDPKPQTLSPVQNAILHWYTTHGRDLPWRQTRDPYRILVAEVMLQQTQVERVLPKYQQWLDAYPTLTALAEAPTAEIIRIWAPLGYNSRAVRLQTIARQCVEGFDGQMPASLEQLLQLKGVGRYTAGAIACFAYEAQVAFWDTNVRRVLTRLLRGHDVVLPERAMDDLAADALPPAQSYNWHQALMDMGATICTNRNPSCDLCPAMHHCASHPAILFAPRMLSERKVNYDPGPFETTNRYFRGRTIDALRRQSPLTLPQLADQLGRDERAWLDRLLTGLERDGLLVRSGDTVRLP